MADLKYYNVTGTASSGGNITIKNGTSWGDSMSAWLDKSSNMAALSGGFQIAGGLLSSFNTYKQAKKNYKTAIENAQQLREYADEVAEDMRKEQWYREGENIVNINARSGLAGGSFSDLLRQDFIETDQAARKQQNQLYAQARAMEKAAKKAKKKAKKGLGLSTALGIASAGLALPTGGASLAVGGGAMGVLSSYY